MRRWVFVALIAFFVAGSALAQDASRRLVAAGAGAAAASAAQGESKDPAPAEPRAKPLLPPIPERILEFSGRRGDGRSSLDPSTPRGAVTSYLRACRAGDFPKAAEYLDLQDLPESERREAGARLAKRLKIVLDRTMRVDPELLSGAPEGRTDDDLGPEIDRVGTIESDGGSFDINVWRRSGEDGASAWAFTPGTLRRLDVLYDEFGYSPFVEGLPDWMIGARFLALEAWQWIGLAGLLILAYGLSFLMTWLLYRVVRWFTRRTATNLDDRLLEAVHRPVRGICALILFLVGLPALALAVRAQTLVIRLAGVVWAVLVVLALIRLVDALTGSLAERFTREGRRSGLSTIVLTRRVLKVLVILLGLLALMQSQGFNVSGLLAGLGIGGIAVALAAQKTIENVFGGIVLSTDQPIRVGDFCKFGDKQGVIEDVGLRSTRVRTLDRTIVTVPNAELSTIQIENFAMRERIRLLTTIGLRYETTPDQLRWVLAEIRKLLLSHPKVDANDLRVRFIGFGATSLDVEIVAYVATTEFPEFAAIREDLFLRLMDVVAASGTGFAFPSQTLYLRRDPGIDLEATRRAEEQVRTWRESGDLPFPDPEPERSAGERGTLDWPPRGSVAHRKPPPSGVSEE